ncbi:MAG: hypothetical protein CML68_05440 [Rhodobacteraceae bacterium]|nr:hypothetical protein [Paracoccaceae bacterium]
MIQYSLKCAEGHAFDSWFQSASAFDKLATAGMVACVVCGCTRVEKSMMAPRVRPSRSAAGEAGAVKQDAPKGGDLRTPASELEKAVAAMRREVESKADYVGLEFAAEARAMHNGESPERAIYGEARLDEAKKLVDEGVPVAPLPFRPQRKTN